jgi:hypothetical protein
MLRNREIRFKASAVPPLTGKTLGFPERGLLRPIKQAVGLGRISAGLEVGKT